jgi:hypothetical protein
VVLKSDVILSPTGASSEVSGASAVAKHFSGRAQTARVALVNGSVGVVIAPRGRLFIVLDIKVSNGKIREINVIADPAHLLQVEIAVLKD